MESNAESNNILDINEQKTINITGVSMKIILIMINK